MSSVDPVLALLAKLSASSKTIAEAYYQGRVHKNEENFRDIERLRQLRLLSPDIRDAFQLRASFRHFLNAALNTERLFSMGANIGGYFQRLADLVEGHSVAYQEGRDADCERYEVETREAISDIADAIDDELIILQAQVSTRFAAVSTIAEKKRQNLHYQKRTQQLVNLLESFHFSDIGEQLAGHEELALSFKSLLADRIPAFRESLWTILDTLNQYLFEFRKIEERAKRVRAFALHLNRNPDWEPKAWDEVAEPADWLRCATPLEIQTHPDVWPRRQRNCSPRSHGRFPIQRVPRAVQPVRQATWMRSSAISKFSRQSPLYAKPSGCISRKRDNHPKGSRHEIGGQLIPSSWAVSKRKSGFSASWLNTTTRERSVSGSCA